MFRRWKRRTGDVNWHSREQEILAYYSKLWGEPSCKEQFHHDVKRAPQFFTLEFPAKFEGDVWLYATLGASRRSMEHPHGHDARMELFVFAEQQQPELLENIGSLALYPFVLNTYFAPGHTVLGNDDHGIVEGSPLTDIFITQADYGEPPYVCHSDGNHTHLLWVIPVYRQERLYAVEHGEDGLTDLFEQHGTNVFDLWRPPVLFQED